MAWLDDYRPASFRGVSFHVPRHDADEGRRIQIHEYPGRDLPYAEDLGRSAGRYQVEAYVIGPDYFAARDALRAELRKAGPGTLIHPYLGTLTVTVDGRFRFSETEERGGTATFSIPFVEAGENAFPQAVQDSRARVEAAAGTVSTGAQEAFERAFSVRKNPSFVLTEAVKVAGGLLTRAEDIARLVSDPLAALPALLEMTTGVRVDLPALAQAPGNLASRLLLLFDRLGALSFDGGPTVRALASIGDFGDSLPTVPSTTPSRRLQRDNQAALVTLARSASVAEAARKATTVELISIDQAVRLRDDLVARIDPEIHVAADSGEHEQFIALKELRTETVRDLNERAVQLPRLRSVQPGATQPHFLIAQRLYGTGARADEIARLNAIRHPGFTPGGRNLQVLDG